MIINKILSLRSRLSCSFIKATHRFRNIDSNENEDISCDWRSDEKKTYFGVAEEGDDGDEIAWYSQQSKQDASANSEMK